MVPCEGFLDVNSRARALVISSTDLVAYMAWLSISRKKHSRSLALSSLRSFMQQGASA